MKLKYKVLKKFFDYEEDDNYYYLYNKKKVSYNVIKYIKDNYSNVNIIELKKDYYQITIEK